MTASEHPFRGGLTALPTPLADRRLDFRALYRLIERQIEGGMDGIVIGGSTGESSSLSRDERTALFEFAVGAAAGRIAVIAGLGVGDTRETCEIAEVAAAVGVDGLMVSTPAYSRPSQRGLEAHVAAVASGTSLPILLYNIPTRTGVDLVPETVERIAKTHANVVAIKESSSRERLGQLIDRHAVAVLAGDDGWIVDAMELGCAGVVAVVSNLVPDRVARLVHAFAPGGDATSAALEAESVTALASALTLDTNPAPLKAALELLELSTGELRLPLVPVSIEHRARIRAALRDAGLVD